MQETHRPGHLKQTNKQHKHGRHKSKGAINALTKGKVSAKAVTRKFKGLLSKQDRRFQVQQLRTKKRQDVLLKKRLLTGAMAPPALVAVVTLGFEPSTEQFLNEIMSADNEGKVTCSQQNFLHISMPRWKQRLSFISPKKTSLNAILDTVKVADTVLFLMSASESTSIDAVSENVMTCLFTQGIPTPVVALLDLENIPLKKRAACKQQCQKAISPWLPEEKIVSIEKNGDVINLLRRLICQKRKTVHQRDGRPYLLAENVNFVGDDSSSTGTLQVSGYLRGQPLSANSIVHIPEWGDFQINSIYGPPDPHPLEQRESCELSEVLHVADPTKQTPLVAENEPDPMDAEQTWPTREELMDAESNIKKSKKIMKKVPKGTSDYQACWIPDEEGEELFDDDDGSEIENAEMKSACDEESDESVWDEKEDTETVNEVDAENYDSKMDALEEGEALAKLKAARDEASFPDEVDTPQDVPARLRFAKYRGLSSFRTSPWDVNENLPSDYARIFKFENFDRTRRRIMKNTEENLEGVEPGRYVQINVTNVPFSRYKSIEPGRPLLIVGLLPHEHQMSVIHLLVKALPATDQPIKSKDKVFIHCGFRRYQARPIYSQHTNGPKHKYERFLQPGTMCVASMYAPITFPPASVLMFSESFQLVATGRLLSVNPDRLIIKRAILSGHPFRVLKHSAIIRFMFFNREDIEWFKPVELRTKLGRRGHIKEPLGTHGHMKAVFDDQLKSQDTALMMLYKRVFPPWSYEPDLPETPPLYKKLPTIREGKEMET